MVSSYTQNNGVEKPGLGEQNNTWGVTANLNYDILDRAVNGVGTLALSGTASTLTTSDGSLSDGQYKVLLLTGTLGGTHTITISPNDARKMYVVYNLTNQSVVFTQGSGDNTTILSADSAIIYCTGAGAASSVVNVADHLAMSSPRITGGSISSATISGGTISGVTSIGGTTITGTNMTGTTFDINAGTIDGTSIGAATPSTGAFTTLSSSGNATLANSSFFVSSSTFRVGIGTTSPDVLIHAKVAFTPTMRWENTTIPGYSQIQGTASNMSIQVDPSNVTANSVLDFDIDGAQVASMGPTGLRIGTSGGNPTYPLQMDGTSAAKLPVGTTAQRPGTTTQGLLRYNTDLGSFEAYNASAWKKIDAGLAQLSLAAGDLLYATGADTLTRLPKGTALQNLRMNAGETAPEWALPTLQLTAANLLNGVTASDFEDIPSWVNRITLVFYRISSSAGGDVLVQLGTGDPVTWVTSEYFGTNGNRSTNSYYSSGFVVSEYSDTVIARTMATICKVPGTNAWVETHTSGSSSSAPSHGGGSILLDAPLTGVRVRLASGTFDDAASRVHLILE
jgi:hypothetical protein